ncbi:alpha/beta hydrolase [Nitrosomonas sp.]|uniref:alpha/beta fold hydrolase n=1 Tax=Nitrosomonas sp. TaxID=42353 RepID=UPI0026344CB5|nr:alpha/beta hydrolase [Nitrosomonas sp.]MCW5600271.1 alpha/beta hydrolase [Nitrosomonas sp.]
MMRICRVPVLASTNVDRPIAERYIAYTDWGSLDNPHVVICVHGLTRNCRDFDFLAAALEDNFRVICVDVVGRGLSSWLTNAENYNQHSVYLSDAMLLIQHICNQYQNNVHLYWVGVSMGGLIGMALANQAGLPASIKALVMSDIGPFIPANAFARLSAYVGKDPRFTDFDEFKAYLKTISAPFGPLTEKEWHHLAIHSARKFSDGTYGFNYDPSVSISFQKYGAQDLDLWNYWDPLCTPTLVIRGLESDVLMDDTSEAMKIRGPKANIIDLPNVGHAPMLINREQIAIVKNFLLELK